MADRMYKENLIYLKDDFVAGIVVFLVAVPLSLGIALATNVPLFSGILTAIIGGIVVGFLSDSPVSVSGPAAGMIAVVLAAIQQLGGFEPFLLALMLAGLFQLITGLLRMGFIADYIPSNVIQGLMCAIGILIIIKQLPLAFTHPAQHPLLLETLKTSAQNFDFNALRDIETHISWGALIITLLSLTLLLYQDNTKVLVLKKIPGPILMVILGIILNEIYTRFFPQLTQDSAQLVNVPLYNQWYEIFTQFTFPNWHSWLNSNVYLYAFLLAAVASLETLLNLEATEKMDRKHKYCSRNRELLAQGIGNMLSGLLGGLPITSVLVRSSVNIQTGARSKVATIIHGVLFLLAVLLISNWLNKIPLASLAAILLYVGYKLTKVSIYREIYEKGIPYYLPFALTVVTIVFTNILLGIALGLTSSIFFILRENSKMRLNIIEEHHPSGRISRLVLPQQISFLSKAYLISELNAIPKYSRFVIDARGTQYIDRDILEFIKEFAHDIAPNKKIELNLLGFKTHYEIHDRIEFISVTTHDVQTALTPSAIIQILKAGNQRFIKDQRINRYFPAEIQATSKAQYPLAVVLSCIDSRVPVETIFDVGVGDLFITRVAGNVVNEDVLGGIEFACCLAQAKLILVLGHTRCGAIQAACKYTENGYIRKLLDKILPAVQAEQVSTNNNDLCSENALINITQRNIANSVNAIYHSSPIISQLVDEKKIGLVSAMYDVRSGKVEFHESKE